MAVQSFPAGRSRISAITFMTAAAGAALLAVTIWRVGGAEVVSGVASVGWAFVLVVALGALRMAVRARAWMVCAEEPAPSHARTHAPSHLSFGEAFRAILAADALGNLTPLGLLASEPAKVMLVRSRLSTATSVASVTIENACYTASVAVVLLTGTWFFLRRADVPPVLERAGDVVVIGALMAGVVGVWAARARPAVLSRLAPFLARLVGKAAAPDDTLREVEARIYGVLHWPVARLVRIGFWEAAFHVAAVLEVWLVLRLLPGGEGAGLKDAFLMESAGRFVTVAFKFIPYRLGVDEAGSGAVAQMLGFAPVTGVTLALVRRLRILCLNVVGLVLFVRRR